MSLATILSHAPALDNSLPNPASSVPDSTVESDNHFLEALAKATEAEEVPRPSLADVLTVAGHLAAAAQSGFGQEVPDAGTVMADSSRLFHARPVGVRAHSGEGQTHKLVLSPGTIGTRVTDVHRKRLTVEKGIAVERTLADIHAMWLDQHAVYRIEDRKVLGFVNPEWDYDFAFQAVYSVEKRKIAYYQDPRGGLIRGEITQWSAKSRANMLKVLGQLDYNEWDPSLGPFGMTTLTLPDQWEILTPSGAIFKKHVASLRRRWEKQVGPFICIWKLEFQRRGAPHWHALTRVPAFGTLSVLNEETGIRENVTVPFEQWLSTSWAEICGASKTIDRTNDEGVESSEYSRHLAAGTAIDFSGEKFSDPRRIALYFYGHSAKSTDGKEYQHIVPELWQAPGKGPGRFWAVSGIPKAVVEVDLDPFDYDRAQAILRKVRASAAWKMRVIRERGYALRDGRPEKSPFKIQTPGRRKKMSTSSYRRYRRNLADPTFNEIFDVATRTVVGSTTESPMSNYTGGQFADRGGQGGGTVILNDPLTVGMQLARYLTETADCQPGCTWCGHLEPSAVGHRKRFPKTYLV